MPESEASFKACTERILSGFEVSEEARRQFTKQAHGAELAMRRKADPHYGKICRFFDTDARRCTVYEARPAVCRQYPNGRKCGYYDFLRFERKHQDDPDFIPSA